MNDHQRRIMKNERDILQAKVDGYRDMLANMNETRTFWDKDIFAREEDRCRNIIATTQKQIADIDAELNR